MAGHIKTSAGDKAYLGIIYLFLGLFTICTIYPLVYVVSCSFSSPEALVQGRVFFWPVEFGLQGYQAVFKKIGRASCRERGLAGV